ncbi:MAG: hydrogenase maturation protease [Promethearchaeota archaeon]
MTTNNKILVLGIGNEILGDDRLGIEVVLQLKQQKPQSENIHYLTAPIAGLDVIDLLLDYNTVIIVDSWITNRKQKRIRRIEVEDLEHTVTFTSPHQLNLVTGINLGKKLFPERMPNNIIMLVGEISPVEEFSECFSPDVLRKMPQLVKIIEKEITKILKETTNDSNYDMRDS